MHAGLTWAGVFRTPRGGHGSGRTGGRCGPHIAQTHTWPRLHGRKVAPWGPCGRPRAPSGAEPVPAGAWAAPHLPASGRWTDLVSVSNIWVTLTV